MVSWMVPTENTINEALYKKKHCIKKAKRTAGLPGITKMVI